SFRSTVIAPLADAVDVGSAWSGVNYEQLAALQPDVVFLEAWVASEENRQMHAHEVDTIEALGIPVIVFVSPSNFEEPDIVTAWEHIEVVGQVFDKEPEAQALVANLEEHLDVVRDRTRDIPESERADVVMFATVDNVMGERSIQSYFLTEILNANNIAGPGTFITVSEEQLLSMDPDVLVVLGHDGYLDPELVYAGQRAGLNWANLQSMRAIEERRVVSVGYDEWRATVETPVGLLKMASVIYPDRFDDIDVDAVEQEFYREVYGLDDDAAATAIDAQRYLGELDD
ncbi:ABC transporter substrate-binding protein, partial [Cellulomonas bogoriensis 69B4 = DSM 16987]